MTSESNIVDTLIQQIINRFSESGVYPYVHSSGLHPVNGDSRLYLFQPAAIDGDSADYFVADRSYEYFTAIARHEHAIFYSSKSYIPSPSCRVYQLLFFNQVSILLIEAQATISIDVKEPA